MKHEFSGVLLAALQHAVVCFMRSGQGMGAQRRQLTAREGVGNGVTQFSSRKYYDII